MDWVKQHWQETLIGLLAAVQILNAATQRWDVMRGPWYKRLLLLLTEMTSIVTSRDHKGWLENVPVLGLILGRLKLPLHPYGGTKKPKGPPSMVGLVLLAGGLALTSCAGTWEENADKAIRTAVTTAEGGWQTARAVYRQRCGELINTCPRMHGLEMCADYSKCAAERRGHATAFRSVLEMCALAVDALEAYKKLKGRGAGDDPGSPAGKLKAEVQERTDRAMRGSSTFMQQLERDGLTK